MPHFKAITEKLQRCSGCRIRNYDLATNMVMNQNYVAVLVRSINK